MKLSSRSRDELTPSALAAYISDVAEQLARLSREMGLHTVAGPLDQAQQAAAQLLHEKAAPEDAA